MVAKTVPIYEQQQTTEPDPDPSDVAQQLARNDFDTTLRECVKKMLVLEALTFEMHTNAPQAVAQDGNFKVLAKQQAELLNALRVNLSSIADVKRHWDHNGPC